ncbi:hypothetical protein Tco_1115896 [Tanacetum coccineum]
MDLDFVADGNLRELSGEEAWEAIENFPQGKKEWDNPPNIISEQEEYAPPVTYPEEVNETIGTPIEVEPSDETQLEDLGLNTYNHDIPLSNREVPSFDEPEPQPHPLPNCPSLDMIEDDLELESKEVSFLLRGLNSTVRPKEVEKVIFDEKKLGSS